ncbi:hypothetical protein PanWU01x14_358440 [Parasponia andersonii]|uniref:Uncharacterized protein n=1 Tax=Parasponia andersonii TaxID=3476 RepID=A0A2P5A8B9_PARAD|nr:hypothetical protein PanWU01x14_358440 [Parasponia andersonii]
MDATGEHGGGILHHILPPSLEDAGLEDCALPPNSIKEAFLKAATAVKSRAASILTTDEHDEEGSDGDCVKDFWPAAAKDRSWDLVGVGVSPEAESPGACTAEKGVDVGGGEVVVVEGEGDKEDEVVGGKVEVENGGKACVEGLQGLEIDEKKNGGADEEDER